MILSLVFALCITLPVIAIVGVSDLGNILIGNDAGATYQANASFYACASSIRLTPMVLILMFVTLGFSCLLLAIYALERSETHAQD
jgi:hypothetical protein